MLTSFIESAQARAITPNGILASHTYLKAEIYAPFCASTEAPMISSVTPGTSVIGVVSTPPSISSSRIREDGGRPAPSAAAATRVGIKVLALLLNIVV